MATILCGIRPALVLVGGTSTRISDMDWHAEWTKAKHQLSEASKNHHAWVAMPRDVRSRMSVVQYRQKRATALQRLKQADAFCREAAAAARRGSRKTAA